MRLISPCLGILVARVTSGDLELPAEGFPEVACDSTEISIASECPRAGGSVASWTAYATELYAARAEAFALGPAAAAAAVHELLASATEKFSDTFGGKSLTARVRSMDDESVLMVPAAHREPGLRVAVVTICAYAEDEPVRVLCAENRRLYAALHGYDMYFFTDPSEIAPHAAAEMDVTDGMHKAFFWKVNAVRNVMDMDAYDWVLWMDCDAFFMDPERTIDSVIMMYSGNATPATRLPPPFVGEAVPLRDLRQRVHADAAVNVSLIVAVDSTGINNGVWMLRDTPWSREFLRKWWHSDILEGPGKEHNCSDQSTMLHTLLHERAMLLDEAWDAVEAPVWPPQVRVAAQEHLQSFHDATAMAAMSRAWEDGDFIKHHPGCHYYKVPCQFLYDEAQGIFRTKAHGMGVRR